MAGQESAETLALQALGWLVAQDELLPQFFAATGANALTLPTQAADPEFLGAVLDFLLMEDATVIAFCAKASGLEAAAPSAARVLRVSRRLEWKGFMEKLLGWVEGRERDSGKQTHVGRHHAPALGHAHPGLGLAPDARLSLAAELDVGA